ncbi:hypothetical protein NEOKW01_1416 [Nematocida sp. AWRm80]|nr:hypothetical protein NEOKW01_1416 [Nematocida sp. AWRm80]
MFIVFLVKTLLIGCGIIGCALGFVACLYKGIHFIEEYPNRAKEKIRLLIYTVLVLHTILLFRGFSIMLIGFSLLCQFMFYNLLEDYPNIETGGAGFISAVVMAFLNHMFFLNNMFKHRLNMFEIIFYFVIIVWAVPFMFFLSLTANDDVITIPGVKKPIKRTFAGKIIDALLSRDNIWEDR